MSNPHIVKILDFESSASANSATPATNVYKFRLQLPLEINVVLILVPELCHASTIKTLPRQNAVVRQIREVIYKKVLDQRKRPIRGLWSRNGRFYAQITVKDQVTGLKQVKRVPLEGAVTEAQAVAKFQKLPVQRRKRALPALKRTPKFAD